MLSRGNTKPTIRTVYNYNYIYKLRRIKQTNKSLLYFFFKHLGGGSLSDFNAFFLVLSQLVFSYTIYIHCFLHYKRFILKLRSNFAGLQPCRFELFLNLFAFSYGLLSFIFKSYSRTCSSNSFPRSCRLRFFVSYFYKIGPSVFNIFLSPLLLLLLIRISVLIL